MRINITVLLLVTLLAGLGAAQVSRPQANQQVRNIEAANAGQAKPFRLPQSQHVTGAHYPAVTVSQRPYHEHRALIVPKGPIRPLKTISPPTAIHQINRQTPQTLPRPISLQSPAGEMPVAFHVDPAAKPGRSFAMAMPPPPTPVDIFTNTDFGSVLGNDRDGEEDSEASAGNVVFFTGNWFAAYSSDGGATFRYIDPTTVFPGADGGFCCDQAVIYMPQIDRFAWLIQYNTNTSGENRYRLAIASPSDVTKAAGTAWTYYDLTSAMFGLTKEWMDFPELAVGKNSLYIAANIFGTPTDAQHIVMRIPVSALAAGGGSGDYFIWKENNNSNFALAQNSPSRLPETTQFWTAHNSTSQIRVFSWAEGSASPTHKDLDIGSWPFADHSSLTPDGVDWLRGLQTNMRAANDGNNLWLAFPVGRDDPEFVKDTKPPVVIPQPHIKVVRISLASMTVVEEQYIWDSAAAYSFPTLAANSSRQIGIACAWGGNPYYANVAVGVLNSPSGEPFAPYLISVATSSIGEPWWGDYINVREHYPDTGRFSGGVFSINKTSTSIGYKNHPHFLIFGQNVTETPFHPR
jgi:hypothetical protein